MSEKGDKKKATNVVKKGIFQGRRCFICNEQLKGNTCQLSKANTKFTSTPFAKCLNEVMAPQYEVTVGKNDKSCQRCAALIQQRDKFIQDLEGVNKALCGFLTRKYTLMTITSKHNTVSDIDPNCIRQVTTGVSSIPGQQSGLKGHLSTSSQMHIPQRGAQRGAAVGKSASRGRKKQSTKTLQLYQCVECHSSTTDPSDLKNHVCVKETEKPSVIQDVSKVPAGNKVGHIKILHPIKPGDNKVPEKFICRFCDVEFNKREDFVAHNREHLSASSDLYECKVCSEIFAARVELEDHKKSHQPVKCTSCLEIFTNVDTLAAHLTPTLKINANHCSPCNTSFATKDDITTHIANFHSNMKEDNENPIHVMKLTYVCTCCQNELEEFKEFSRHKDEHITDSVAQSKDLPPLERMQSDNEAQSAPEETEHDYAMEVNEPSTSNTCAEKENKENTTSGPKKPVYECGMCSMRAESVEKLMEHFKTHKSTKILCKHCHIQLPSVNALSKHLQYHTLPGQGVECQLCTPSVTLQSKEMLMRHMADLHRMKHHCPHCGEQFRFLKELVNHQNMHPEARKFGCPKCGMRFLHANKLQRHLEMQHRDPRCRVCSKVIRNPIKLRQHESRHRNDKYSCPKCERIFKTPSGLKNHMAIHTGEYKYRCDTCERGFMSRNIFIEHTNNHLDNPKPLYKCNICGKNFFYQGSLWIHRKWHNNPYPYECKLCGKKLRHASVLQVHMRKHRGERPYKCPYCPMTFNSPSTFKRHLMLHTGEYSFKCTDCNKGFTGKNKYLMHRHSIHGDPLPKKPIMTAMDFKVNVPVQHANSTTNLSGHPTAYIVENMGSCESGNEDDVVPRVVEVVINEEQQAVSSITLLAENVEWNQTTTAND